MSADTHMTDFISDMLASQIAQSKDCSDFIVRQNDDELIYVDVEGNTLWLITVHEGTLQVAQPSPRAEGKPTEGKDA